MESSIAVRGLGAMALCVLAGGCAAVTPVAYSDVASSAYMTPDTSDSSGRVRRRSTGAATTR